MDRPALIDSEVSSSPESHGQHFETFRQAIVEQKNATALIEQARELGFTRAGNGRDGERLNIYYHNYQDTSLRPKALVLMVAKDPHSERINTLFYSEEPQGYTRNTLTMFAGSAQSLDQAACVDRQYEVNIDNGIVSVTAANASDSEGEQAFYDQVRGMSWLPGRDQITNDNIAVGIRDLSNGILLKPDWNARKSNENPFYYFANSQNARLEQESTSGERSTESQIPQSNNIQEGISTEGDVLAQVREELSQQDDKNPGFLKKRYPTLHTSKEVKSAAERNYQNPGEKVSHNPLTRIQNYLDRLSHIINPSEISEDVEAAMKDEFFDPKFDRRRRNIERLRSIVYDRFVIEPESDAFLVSTRERLDAIFHAKRDGQGRPLEKNGKPYKLSQIDRQAMIAWEQGQGAQVLQADLEGTRQSFIDATIGDQRRSLDRWVNYLTSKDAFYPDWLKYYAFRSIVEMSAYDKEAKAFGNRSKDTTKPFPELNREALSYVLDAIKKKYAGTTNLDELAENDRNRLTKLLEGENFSKLYAFALEKVTSVSKESLAETQGAWVRYPQNVDPMSYRPQIELDGEIFQGMALVSSLQEHSTGWCTAGEATAREQLKGGDFYVFYSLDTKGKPTIPRVAIRMNASGIAEVRGVAPGQNLDPDIGPVVSKKLEQFPDGEVYQKKSKDMNQLTDIYNRAKAEQSLHKEDLLFLYEINASIEGFGYEKDPRIAELINSRNISADISTVFGVTNEQIARNKNEITVDTKVYAGRLEADIFSRLPPNIEFVYANFPYGRVNRETAAIGGIQPRKLRRDVLGSGSVINWFAEKMMESRAFIPLDASEDMTLVTLRLEDMGLKGKPTINKIYRRARKLGLELCPPEVGAQMLIRNDGEPLEQRVAIAMEPMRFGLLRSPFIFALGETITDDNRWKPLLDQEICRAWDRWMPDNKFTFCVRKK